MTTSWDDEFRCWNTDEPVSTCPKSFCEFCGANKPYENHELWCPNEPDRLAKDDETFWLDDECCPCEHCEGPPEQEPYLLGTVPFTPGFYESIPNYVFPGAELPAYTTGHPPAHPPSTWSNIRPVFDPEGVGAEQATADGLNPHYVPPSRNPAFDALLEQMRVIHNCKNQDYAEEGNPYSNFEFAAKTAGCSVDTVFRTLIGVKLARLDELLKGKTPKFESIADTRLDLAIYSALWASYGN